MAMHNPPHPDEFLQATYLDPFNISGRYLGEQQDVAASTLNRVFKMQGGASARKWLCVFQGFRA